MWKQQVSYPCPDWQTAGMVAVVVVECLACLGLPQRSCVRGVPPVPWQDGCVLGTEPLQAASGPVSLEFPELSCSSGTGALLPSDDQEHKPTSATHNVMTGILLSDWLSAQAFSRSPNKHPKCLPQTWESLSYIWNCLRTQETSSSMCICVCVLPMVCRRSGQC